MNPTLPILIVYPEHHLNALGAALVALGLLTAAAVLFAHRKPRRPASSSIPELS